MKKLLCLIGLHQPDGIWYQTQDHMYSVCKCENCPKIHKESHYDFAPVRLTLYISILIILGIICTNLV